MPEGTVTNRSLSKSNKLVVNIDGQDYYPGKTDMTAVKVGDRIAFESSSWNYRGTTFWGINSWKLLQPSQKTPLPTPRGEEIPAPSVPGAVSKGLGLMSEGERLCVSNWIGQAIAAKTVTEPEQIEKWISAARNALRSQSE